MTIPEILEKIKKELSGVDKKTLLIACLSIAVLYLGWAAWHSPDPVDVQGLLSTLEARLTEKHQLEMKEKEAKIKELSKRYSISDSKHQQLLKELERLRNANTTAVPPKTNRELRDRFTALGFPPK